MLRSFAYAASASVIQRDVEPPEGWEEQCRSEFLEGYLGDRRAGPAAPDRKSIERLLTVFELEKAVYELRYELGNRPDWVSIPVAGILRMLEAGTMRTRRARPPPRGRGPARADLRAPRRARRRPRASRSPSGLPTRARSRSSATGTAGTAGSNPLELRRLLGDLGGGRARGLGRRRLQVRGSRRRRAAAPEGRSLRLLRRGAAEDRVEDLQVALRVGRRRLARAPPQRSTPLKEPLSIYEVHAESWRLGLAGRSSPTSSSPTPTSSASRTSSACRSCTTRSPAPGAIR